VIAEAAQHAGVGVLDDAMLGLELVDQVADLAAAP
jgi:hypothetical protein